jgi:hypothetical protein
VQRPGPGWHHRAKWYPDKGDRGTTSLGWTGAVAAFFALAVTGVASQDAATVRGAYLAMNVITWSVILPLAMATLLMGTAQALGSRWGLLRHYWVVAKLAITVVAFVVFLTKLPLISHLAAVAATTTPSAEDGHTQMELVLHSGGGLLVLLVPAELSVLKPRGMTSYGQRKQLERRTLVAPAAGFGQ